MLDLRQGRRRFKLSAATNSTVTLENDANVKVGEEAYLVRGDAKGSHRLVITITGQDGLVVRFDRVKRGRPRKDVDMDKVRAMQTLGLSQGEIAKHFGVTRRTLERRLSRARKKKKPAP